MADIIQGLDISHHQGNVDIRQIADAGFRFCICKATEGGDWRDPRFLENMRKIEEYRLLVDESFYAGAFHFARPDNRTGRAGGETEARWFCKVLKETAAEVGFSVDEDFIEPALDFEKYSDENGSTNIPWIEGFLAVLEGEVGRGGMIYTGPNVWMYEVSNTTQFSDRPLWEVTYSASGSSPDAGPIRMPKNDPEAPTWEWTLWQWSGGGDYDYYFREFGPIPGIPGGIADVDRLSGDESVLRQLANAAGPPPPPPSAWPVPPEQVDLNVFRGAYSEYVARVQGLLLAHGYGPSGLTGSNGLPDGLMGNKTQGYLQDFKARRLLPADTVMDWATWWALAYDQLGS